MAPELRRIRSIGPWDVKYSPSGERIWSIDPHDVKYSTLRFFSDLAFFVNTNKVCYKLMQLMQLLQILLANSISSPYIMLTCDRNHVQNIDYPGFSSKVYYK